MDGEVETASQIPGIIVLFDIWAALAQSAHSTGLLNV